MVLLTALAVGAFRAEVAVELEAATVVAGGYAGCRARATDLADDLLVDARRRVVRGWWYLALTTRDARLLGCLCRGGEGQCHALHGFQFLPRAVSAGDQTRHVNDGHHRVMVEWLRGGIGG